MHLYEYLAIGGGIALYAIAFTVCEIRCRRGKRQDYDGGGYASSHSGDSGCD